MSGKKRRREGVVEQPSLEELEVPRRRQKRDRCASLPRSVQDWSTEHVVDSLRKHGIDDLTLQLFCG